MFLFNLVMEIYYVHKGIVDSCSFVISYRIHVQVNLCLLTTTRRMVWSSSAPGPTSVSSDMVLIVVQAGRSRCRGVTWDGIPRKGGGYRLRSLEGPLVPRSTSW